MHRRGSNNRLAGLIIRTRISTVMLAMIATMASVYVAGRLWQDAESRVYLIKELDRRTGQMDQFRLLQGQSAVSVDDTLKVIACREQLKRLSYLETELAAARQEGFISKHKPETNSNHTKRPLLVVGVLTGFGSKNRRNAIRKAWSTHGSLKRLEEKKGIIVRFVIGRSANRGDSLDRAIDDEVRENDDFIILDNHVEAPEELSKRQSGSLFMLLTPGMLSSMLRNHKWYEPDWWKFGDGKSYFRHASGEIYVISQAVAQFVSINRSILRSYAHDDVTVGSWLIGLDVKHIDEAKLCCSSWSSVADSKVSD
ncbi:putative beta-1,3-galactosyltransferase 11 [Acorus calamus]|uniref:Hexosyltransferase n=1 Tax=Acorus calamus TaxID=4465 RepID=A0AAV9C0P8_ACOCL|nr:putative beta-1,3-galactosyltransferase 11 [Acorus calamus]